MLILCQMTNYIFIPLRCSDVNESVDYHVTVLSLLANDFGIFLRGWFYKVSRFLFEIEWNKILRNKRAHTVTKVNLCLHTCCSALFLIYLARTYILVWASRLGKLQRQRFIFESAKVTAVDIVESKIFIS